MKVKEIVLAAADRKRGEFLAYSYLLFYYVRPQEYIPGLNKVPLSGVLIMLFTLWGLIHIRGYFFKKPMVFVFLLGVLMMISGIGVSNVYPMKTGFKYISQFFPQCVALYLIYDSSKRVNGLVNWWVLIYVLMSLITFKNGGLGPGDFTKDPNDAALALSIGLPIVFYSLWQPGIGFWIKILRIGAMLIVIGGIAVTGSRGGFLGLVAAGMGIWWLSEKRVRNLLLGICGVIVFSGVLISLLPAGYLDEMETINDPNDNTRVERLRLWGTAFEMYKDQPIIGVGAGQFRFNAGEFQKYTSWWTGRENNYQGKVVHSFYFQVLSELGTLGSLLFLWAVFYVPLAKFLALKNFKPVTEEEKYARKIVHSALAGMAAFIVSAGFISVAYYPHIPIWITMMTIYWRNMEQVFLEREQNEKI
ncbi:O-antigen ligase family protein [Saccharophagus degradans]|uniref:O-antigen ligase family protein n=1 Tax=Saccharophagus degradans TaxID=86304 RepID=UPI002477DFAD|nr:O-antigen ligase family protein [Saccharophagus degradans]WGO98405.1 O-antigen ligase family protein [Saccharophagus degradans]